jgi:hypothetical protein
LVSSDYAVPARQGTVDGLCQARVESNAQSSDYALVVDCCSSNTNLKIIIQ